MQNDGAAAGNAIRTWELGLKIAPVRLPTVPPPDDRTGVRRAWLLTLGSVNHVFYITVREPHSLNNNSVNLSERRGQAALGAEKSKPRSPHSPKTDPMTL